MQSSDKATFGVDEFQNLKFFNCMDEEVHKDNQKSEGNKSRAKSLKIIRKIKSNFRQIIYYEPIELLFESTIVIFSGCTSTPSGT